MAEELTWELMRNSIASFSHDSVDRILGAASNLNLLAHRTKNSKLEKLLYALDSLFQEIRGIHVRFRGVRDQEEPPKDLQGQLQQYRRELDESNKKILPILQRLASFKKAHAAQLREEDRKTLGDALEHLERYVREFPAREIGERIKVRARHENLFLVLKKLLGGKFVDRDGNPVKIKFNGKNIGDVNFDYDLMSRIVENLVTDAINHTPGRPIKVTLERNNGTATINVTNKGKKLTPAEIAKIGRERFTKAWHDPKRGYGKISVRMLTEAQGGRFHAGNSRIGPMLSVHLPIHKTKK